MTANNGPLPGRYAWHAKSFDPRKASIRLRLIQPMEFLRQRGVSVENYSSDLGTHAYDGIIFSKSYSQEAVCIAREARALNRPVVFDICDNLFEGKARLDKRKRVSRLKEMMSLATHITFSTPVLAEQVRSIMPEIGGRCQVIPDTMDCLTEPAAGLLSGEERQQLRHLQSFLSRHRQALHCVWFGKSQGNLSGFAHLDAAIKELELFARTHPVTLTIISNARWRYWFAASRWKLPTHYIPWSLNTFDQSLRAHRVAIVPVRRNQYTVGKTINRPATAIAAGLGVIADSIDSYEELRPFIPLDDWQGGLNRYLHNRPDHDEQLAAAKQHLHNHYGMDAIGQQWQGLLEQLARHGSAS